MFRAQDSQEGGELLPEGPFLARLLSADTRLCRGKVLREMQGQVGDPIAAEGAKRKRDLASVSWDRRAAAHEIIVHRSQKLRMRRESHACLQPELDAEGR